MLPFPPIAWIMALAACLPPLKVVRCDVTNHLRIRCQARDIRCKNRDTRGIRFFDRGADRFRVTRRQHNRDSLPNDKVLDLMLLAGDIEFTTDHQHIITVFRGF